VTPLILLALAAPPVRPVATYSIVARDSATGELGVAVQSHWFSVGAVVPWAEAGVGAVATQSFIDPSYGALGLDLMRAGKSAPEALAALLAADAQRDVRQVGMVDARGRVARHTGRLCIPAAGDQAGAQYVVQANLMERATVWPAMARAFEAATGDLAERLMAALEAAEAEGGDIRGRQSAALLVVKAHSTGRPWADRRFDLRVEDHPEPLPELRRLLRLNGPTTTWAWETTAWRPGTGPVPNVSTVRPAPCSPTTPRWRSGMAWRWPPPGGWRRRGRCSPRPLRPTPAGASWCAG